MMGSSFGIIFLLWVFPLLNADPQQFGGIYGAHQVSQPKQQTPQQVSQPNQLPAYNLQQVSQPNQLPAYNPQQVSQPNQLPAYSTQKSQLSSYGPQQQFQIANYGLQQPQSPPAPNSYGQQQQFPVQPVVQPQSQTDAFHNAMFGALTTPPSLFNMWDQPPPPIPTKPPPLVEPYYTFKEGTLPTYCGFGVNPIPVYTDPSKKCVPYHPGCGILFTCILNV